MKKRIDRVDIRGVAKIGAIRSGGLLRAIKITEESKRGLKTKACERSGRARRKANHPQIASHAGLSKRVDGLKEGFKVRELATTIVATAVVRAAGPQESNEKPRGVHVYPLLARVNKIPFRRRTTAGYDLRPDEAVEKKHSDALIASTATLSHNGASTGGGVNRFTSRLEIPTREREPRHF